MFGRRGFHLSTNPFKPFQQQVLEVPPDTVNADKPQVMDMKISAAMSFLDFARVNFPKPITFTDLRGNIVVKSLQRKSHIAVFIAPPVLFIQITRNEVRIKFIGDFTDLGMLFAVKNIGLGALAVRGCQQNLFNNVLDFFDGMGLIFDELMDKVNNPYRQFLGHFMPKLAGSLPRFPNGGGNLAGIKNFFLAVSFDNTD